VYLAGILMKLYNTGIEDFWGLEVCNGFGGRRVQKSDLFLSIWSGLVARGQRFAFFAKYCKTSPKVSKVTSHHF